MTRRLAEVARKVGVSEATVSRVLNGKPGVAESTRQAVLTALDVLGYERPTKLRGERARLVGLVLPELQNPIFPAFAEVVGVASRPAGLHARPVHADGRRRLGGRLRRAAAPAAGLGRRLRRRPVRPGGRAPRPLRAARRARAADGPGQRVDRGTRLPARVVRRRGRGRAGDGPPPLARAHRDRDPRRPARPHPVEAQARGRPGGRAEAGIALGSDRIAHAWYSIEAAQAGAARLIDAGVTGIVCASDLMALGAIRAARRAGRTRPRRRLDRRASTIRS